MLYIFVGRLSTSSWKNLYSFSYFSRLWPRNLIHWVSRFVCIRL